MPVQTEEARIILATEAIRTFKKLSRRKAAQIYNVPEATLRYRMNSRRPRLDSQPTTYKLTAVKKEAIVQHVLDLDLQRFLPWLAGVEDMTNPFSLHVIISKL